MYGLTIPMFTDRERQFIHLRDLFDILGSNGEQSFWQVKNVEALGKGADELHLASDMGCTFVGSDLKRLIADVDQVIDGEFSAFKSNHPEPWIIIRAVDSTAYDIITDDFTTFRLFKCAFASSKDIPGMEPPAIM